MALLGKIEQYDPEQEEWPQYMERLEQFFKANDLTGDEKANKRWATFLSVIGPAPYKLLRSLLAPAKPKEKKYNEVVTKLTEHYSPTPSEVMQRFCFNSRSRKGAESVATYVAELRRLVTQHYNYGDTLDKMLRDRTEGRVQVTCHRCGKPGHLATVCRFRDSVCHKCKKKGHLAKVCKSKSQPQPTPQGKPTKRTALQLVRQLDEESDTDSDDSIQLIMTIGQRHV